MKTADAGSSQTIVAQATPRGRGALAIVRLSGADAITIAAQMVRHPERLMQADSHAVQIVRLQSVDNSVLDHALCAIYRAPRSYTGENVVEFSVHGSAYIISRTIEHTQKLGARAAAPGEFTQRAFLNGRMDLLQAEAVADLIAASSRRAHRIALAQAEGSLSRRIGLIRQALMNACSLVELQIDFADQDVPILDFAHLEAALAEIQSELTSLEATYLQGRLVREGACVAIAGAPNAGKSTLFNALLGEDRAIVDAQPGTTRDAVEGIVEWDGLAIRLQDTAGIGEPTTSPDRQAVEKAQRSACAADLVLWLVDLSNPDATFVPPAEIADRSIIIGNKVDSRRRPEKNDCALFISALHGDGLADLKQIMLARLLPPEALSEEEGILTSARQAQAVRQALIALCAAAQLSSEKRCEELIAADLREVSLYLGEIIGDVTPDDILNQIFSQFCIGK